MKKLKFLKSAIKIVLFSTIVIALEHAMYFSLEWYKSLPMDCERTETFEKFIFFVSPKTSDEVAGLSSEQLLVAEIRISELAGQTYEDVLKNKFGPIQIIGNYLYGGFEEFDLKTDLSSFEIQSVSD